MRHTSYVYIRKGLKVVKSIYKLEVKNDDKKALVIGMGYDSVCGFTDIQLFAILLDYKGKVISDKGGVLW